MTKPNSGDVSSFSRRSFLKSLGTSAVAAAAAQAGALSNELETASQEKIEGPSAVPIRLQVNGQPARMTLEPRVTLLDALRDHSRLTGPKEVCDRATCGACTVWYGGQPIYSCMKLAIDAQDQPITTIEGLAKGGALTPLQKAFIDKDALMCGYCTPGFIMCAAALLAKNPQPKLEELRHGLAGNLCRCGTYPRILEAVAQTAGVQAAQSAEVLSYADLA